jgi:hypothetical protein
VAGLVAIHRKECRKAVHWAAASPRRIQIAIRMNIDPAPATPAPQSRSTASGKVRPAIHLRHQSNTTDETRDRQGVTHQGTFPQKNRGFHPGSGTSVIDPRS